MHRVPLVALVPPTNLRIKKRQSMSVAIFLLLLSGLIKHAVSWQVRVELWERTRISRKRHDSLSSTKVKLAVVELFAGLTPYLLVGFGA